MEGERLHARAFFRDGGLMLGIEYRRGNLGIPLATGLIVYIERDVRCNGKSCGYDARIKNISVFDFFLSEAIFPRRRKFPKGNSCVEKLILEK